MLPPFLIKKMPSSKCHRPPKPDKYICSCCHKTYLHRRSFIRHQCMMAEKELRIFKCDICQKQFKRRDILNRHMRNRNLHQNQNKRKCMITEKEIHIFECDICQKQFKKRDILIRHLRYVHQNWNNSKRMIPEIELCIYKCDICQKQYKRKDVLIRHLRNVHQNQNKRNCMIPEKELQIFECDTCQKQFKKRGILIRHLRNLHENQSNRKWKIAEKELRIFECDTCQKQFKKRDVLIRHLRNLHQNQSNHKCMIAEKELRIFECDICQKQFKKRDILIRHLRNLHQNQNMMLEKKLCIFKCDICQKQYKRKDVLKQHLQNVHQKLNNFNASYVCALCYMTFLQRRTLIRHIHHHMCTEKKMLPPKRGSMKCIFCADLFSSVNNILEHLMQYHDIQILHHHLKFSSKDEFDAWKRNMQNTTITCFRKYVARRNKQECFIQFICHRSGSHQVLTERKKRLKYQGIKKLNGFCPASITLRINNMNGSCKVSYISTHLGHNLYDKKELAHIYIPKADRANLASKIAVDIPEQKHLIDNISSTQAAETDPQFNINISDLFNISGDYEITQTLPPKKDPLYVEAFIMRHEKSILYYKRQNEVDEKYKDLCLNDIVIVMMTPFQEEMLLKYNQKVIAVDGTFGLNHYKFLLHTFLVIDDFHEGIPVVFIISNRNDEVVTKIALESIKDKVGILCPMTFMSDMQLTYINSWEKIMGPVKFCLFCNWHVYEAWRKNLAKIKVADKRKIMSTRLYELAMCLDENIFEAHLQELLDDSDPDLKVFLSYFKNHYSQNCKSWAYCYLKHAFVNTNTHCEAFNRNLKYFHGKLLEKSSLTDCLELLDQYLATTERAFERKAINGNMPSKLKCLRKRHDTFEKELEDNKVHIEVKINSIEEGGGWDIGIFKANNNDVANVYHIIKCNNNYCGTGNCKLYCEKCDACQYAYQCTCMDNMIKHNMCEHIHALCTILNSQAKHIIIQEIAEETNTENIDIQLHADDDADKELQVGVVDNSESHNRSSIHIEEMKQDAFNFFINCLNKVTSEEGAVIVQNVIRPLPNLLAAAYKCSENHP